MVFLFIAGNGRTHSGIAFRRPLRWDPCPKPRTRGRTQNVSSPQQTTLPPPAVKDAESVNGGASKAGGRRACPFLYTGGRSRGKATAQLREAISFHKAIRPSRGALSRDGQRHRLSAHLIPSFPVSLPERVSLRLESKTEEATFPSASSKRRRGRGDHSLKGGKPPLKGEPFPTVFACENSFPFAGKSGCPRRRELAFRERKRINFCL